MNQIVQKTWRCKDKSYPFLGYPSDFSYPTTCLGVSWNDCGQSYGDGPNQPSGKTLKGKKDSASKVVTKPFQAICQSFPFLVTDKI